MRRNKRCQGHGRCLIMVNIVPPGPLEWALLAFLGSMAGLLNALYGIQRRRKTDWLVVSIAMLSAIFAAVTTFLILHSLLPVLLGVAFNNYGLVAFSAVVAHLGLKESIDLAMKIGGKK